MINTLTIDSLIFNQAGGSYHITETPGLYMPPIRHQAFDLASEHFGIYVSSYYGKRRFSIMGWVTGTDAADFQSKRDALVKTLDISGKEEKPITIVLANGRQVQINAVCISLDFPIKAGIPHASQFSMSFEASFPFLVSASENSQNISLATGGGGKVVPDTMPMGLNADAGGRIFVVNSGNAIYYPTARISGSVENPSLKNSTLNKELRFNITLAEGEYIDIDFKRKTVTDNVGANRYSVIAGEWWFLQPGTSEVRFIADTYSASALVSFNSRDAWLGI